MATAMPPVKSSDAYDPEEVVMWKGMGGEVVENIKVKGKLRVSEIGGRAIFDASQRDGRWTTTGTWTPPEYTGSCIWSIVRVTRLRRLSDKQMRG